MSTFGCRSWRRTTPLQDSFPHSAATERLVCARDRRGAAGSGVSAIGRSPRRAVSGGFCPPLWRNKAALWEPEGRPERKLLWVATQGRRPARENGEKGRWLRREECPGSRAPGVAGRRVHLLRWSHRRCWPVHRAWVIGWVSAWDFPVFDFVTAAEPLNEIPVLYVKFRILEELGPGSMGRNCHLLIWNV